MPLLKNLSKKPYLDTFFVAYAIFISNHDEQKQIFHDFVIKQLQ